MFCGKTHFSKVNLFRVKKTALWANGALKKANARTHALGTKKKHGKKTRVQHNLSGKKNLFIGWFGFLQTTLGIGGFENRSKL